MQPPCWYVENTTEKILVLANTKLSIKLSLWSNHKRCQFVKMHKTSMLTNFRCLLIILVVSVEHLITCINISSIVKVYRHFCQDELNTDVIFECENSISPLAFTSEILLCQIEKNWQILSDCCLVKNLHRKKGIKISVHSERVNLIRL